MASREQQLEYQRNWIARRRADWFEGKVCVLCGSSESLELDHIDPATKVHHNVWSWAKARREAELAKCRPLCPDCHKAKSRTEAARGADAGVAKLTDEKVLAILASSAPGRQLARQYGVDEKAIRLIRRRDTWKHLTVA